MDSEDNTDRVYSNCGCIINTNLDKKVMGVSAANFTKIQLM